MVADLGANVKGAITMNLEKVFGQILRDLRQKRGLSQEQLGFESGYHRTYVSLLERGLKSPSLEAIFRIAMALKVKPSIMIQQVEIRACGEPELNQEERSRDE